GVRNQAGALAIVFGDARALEQMRELLLDGSADPVQGHRALDTLVGAKDKQLPPVLLNLLADPALRSPALKGLAQFDDPQTPGAILKHYASLNAADKRDAVSTLASRKQYATDLLDAVAAKKIPAGDVSADIVRQLRNLNDAALSK